MAIQVQSRRKGSRRWRNDGEFTNPDTAQKCLDNLQWILGDSYETRLKETEPRNDGS